MLDCLQGVKKFTKLNCKNAYNWVQIKSEDEWKTAFWTQFSLFKYLIMLFDLMNASAMSQVFINKALDESKHEEHINTEVMYINSERIHAIKEWLFSEDIYQLQSFRLYNFFWRLIKNYL